MLQKTHFYIINSDCHNEISSLTSKAIAQVSEDYVKASILLADQTLSLILCHGCKQSYLRNKGISMDLSLVNAMPTTLSKEILDLSLKTVAEKRTTFTLGPLEKTKAYYSLHQFCQSCVSDWTLLVPSCHKDVLNFTSTYKENVKTLGVYPCMAIIESLSSMVNLSSLTITDSGEMCLVFGSTEKMDEHPPLSSECLLGLIGKNCPKLKALEIRATVKGLCPCNNCASKFCFSDFPECSVKNPICSSLQVLMLNPESINDELKGIFVENISTLQSFEESDVAFILHDTTRNIVARNLKHVSIHVNRRNYDVLNNIFNKCPEVTSTVLRFIDNFIPPTDLGLNHSNWKNLHNLSLQYPYSTAFPLNFSLVAASCPNLTSLVLANCYHEPSEVTEGNTDPTKFLKLQSLEMEINVLNNFINMFHILGISNKSLTELKIEIVRCTREWMPDLMSVFLQTNFDNLEELMIKSTIKMPATEEEIMEGIFHCPALRKCGEIVLPEQHLLLKNLINECRELGLNISFYIKEVVDLHA